MQWKLRNMPSGKTKVEKIVHWFKNNPILAWIIVGGIIVISIAAFTGALSELKESVISIFPPQKVIFSTDKYYQEDEEIILNFSLINKDKKKTRIINDIQLEILAIGGLEMWAAIPREELEPTNFIIEFKNNKKSLKINETSYKENIENISLLKEEKAYILEPREAFPLSTKFKLNIASPIATSNILFRLVVIYQDLLSKKKVIFSDNIYQIQSVLNRPRRTVKDKIFFTGYKKWSTKKFIEDNLNILRKGLTLPLGDVIFITALGKMHNKRIVPVLINSLEKYEYDPHFFGCLTKALANSKDKRAIKPLIKIVDENKTRDVFDELNKLSATRALERIGDKSVVPSIKKFFEESDSFYLKIEIAQALNKLGENYDLTDIIIDALDNDDTNALFFIKKYECFDEKLVELLIKKLHSEEDYRIKDSYRRTLEEFLLSDSISEFSKNLIRRTLN